MLRAPRQQWKEPPESLLPPISILTTSPLDAPGGRLRCGSALSQPKSTLILLGWPGAKNQEDGDAARELASAFAFSFWQLAPMAGEAGAARICSKRRNWEEEKERGGGGRGR